MHPCMSHYGYLEIQLITRGRRMHASLAQGANAATAMLHLLLEFIQYLDQHLGDAVYNLRDLTSSRSGFAAPDYCEAWIDLHLPAFRTWGS
jgi:acetylornithine deacetylase